MTQFINPLWLLLILILPLYWYYEWKVKSKKRPRVQYPLVKVIKKVYKYNHWSLYIPIIIKSVLIVLIALALARPRQVIEHKDINKKGIDIVFALDLSGSMLAVDFKPVNRIEAAKNVAADFVNLRENDRIGIVTFAEYAYTLSPLTFDHNMLLHTIENLDVDEDQNGTAIGSGIATAITRLKDSEAKSKIIILITDGRNNAGEIDPMTAAELAKTLGIKVYCVAVGGTGPVDFPFLHPIFGVQYRKVEIDIDIPALDAIAKTTGTNKASVATNTEELNRIMEEINSLEKTEITQKNYYEYKETFPKILYIIIVIILFDILRRTVFRREIL
ncbi:MAG: VWA domain-containing protein [Candidatus Cloacimonadales bacterium]|jgi:Ca-activated chloride channel family protein|nr:VWA domain-containing protein [Candidatus Cloacimonadota bacterium]MDD2649761.1 VWA domain-containing protein [Candidatus Cloacimonadota bacterium]MDD3502249.1 VWA domain-containing protein [Candidatus Cloacimonadota bacterium]MDX9977595.1 VWA domain-containing protein [Candidatus Cloacimonadales bacterium]